MTRSLNKVQLIGHITKDPEISKLDDGSTVCNFSVATNRSWTTSKGDKKESVEYHRIVAWHKLADICQELLDKQLLVKATRTYIEGRISYYTYTDKAGIERTATEIIATDIIILS